ncbi:hypothetical protein C8A01DRAFT_20988, partial [Parachaetomium inaequale]
FDIIGGTSTSGLIAFMLSRLHITIDEYSTLSDGVLETRPTATKWHCKTRASFGGGEESY